jgi:hypothetical protein
MYRDGAKNLIPVANNPRMNENTRIRRRKVRYREYEFHCITKKITIYTCLPDRQELRMKPGEES